MSYVIDYKDNNILVNGKPILDINNIRSILDGVSSVNYDTMIAHQHTLNYLDSIKDGTNAATLMQLNMYPMREKTYGYTPIYDKDLHKLENTVTEVLSPYIHQITWTKLKKRSPLNEPLQIENVFRDCGLGPDTFIEQGFKEHSNIATYIDPATRDNNPAKVWPENGETIEFSPEFMELFGLENSSLKSKTVSKLKFDYNLTTHDITFSYNGKDVFGKDPNNNYFSGNTNKNKILKDSRADANTKKALISLKEWGDKMQVLIVLAWKAVHSDSTYTLITCDKVVYTLCLLLGVKCIFTGADSKSGDKKYSITIFEPSDDPIGDAAKRFNKNKEEIIKENDTHIKSMTILSNKSSSPLYIDGVTEPLVLKRSFYENVLTDMQIIQNDLINIPELKYDTDLTISDIEKKIKALKTDYLINKFIRSVKGNLKLNRAKKYTASVSLKPSFGLTTNNNITFYDLARKDYIETTKTVPVSFMQPQNRGTRNRNIISSRQRAGSKFTQKKPTVAKVERNPVKPGFKAETKKMDVVALAFANTDYYFDPINTYYNERVPVEDEAPDDKLVDYILEPRVKDLNRELMNQVIEILSKKGILKFFDSVYSMILVHSYIDNGIPIDYYDQSDDVSQLESLVDNIIENDLVLPLEQENMDVANEMETVFEVPTYQSIETKQGGRKRTTQKGSSKPKSTLTDKLKTYKEGDTFAHDGKKYTLGKKKHYTTKTLTTLADKLKAHEEGDSFEHDGKKYTLGPNKHMKIDVVGGKKTRRKKSTRRTRRKTSKK
jgi:hypothetical protein